MIHLHLFTEYWTDLTIIDQNIALFSAQIIKIMKIKYYVLTQAKALPKK